MNWKVLISKEHPFWRNVLLAILCGVLSYIFGMVQFKIPLLEGTISSLNEIPLLVGVFYISNPLFLIISVLITSLGTPPDGYFGYAVLIHVAGLIPFWYYYRYYLKTLQKKVPRLVLMTILGILGYYLLFLFPLMILLVMPPNPWQFYFSLTQNTHFEIIVCVLVVVLYLLQKNYQSALRKHLGNLEEIIKERTAKLHQTNQQLQNMNETLDQMVVERTKTLENRNIQLTGYAFVNSHLLRAPIARILGLSSLIEKELTQVEDKELVEKLIKSCKELDQVVRLLGEFLSEESHLSQNQLQKLQSRITEIAKEIREIA